MSNRVFERCLVFVATKLAEKLYPTYGEFAKKAFPDALQPENTWQLLRNQPSKNKRGVSLEDACNIAKALGMDVETLCFKTRKELELGWTESQDVCKTKRGSGRPCKRGRSLGESRYSL